jgi:hypothetical protein
VCPPNALKDGKLYQLQIPAASLREFGAYIGKLNAVQPAVPYNAVLTRISFDTDMTFPKLKFEPVGWLSAEQYEAAVARFDDQVTRDHAGLPGATAPAAGLPPKGPEPQVQAQAQAAPAAAAADDDGEWDDSPAPAAKAQAKPQAQAQAPAAAAEDDGWDDTPAPAAKAETPKPQQRRPRKSAAEAAPAAEPATINGATGQVETPAAGDADIDDVFGAGWDD